MWTATFSALSVVLSIFSLVAAFFAVRYANRVAELPQERLLVVESRLALIANSLPEMAATISTVANSVKMARVRNAALHGVGSGGEPDPRSDPEAWRAWKNAQLRTGHGL
jgi:hypothetical protein